MENASHESAATMSSYMEKLPSTNLTTRDSLVRRLERGPKARAAFVESQLNKDLAFQLRSLRDQKDWSQGELAERVGMNQNAISRLENPYYGKATLTTLKRLAATYDVGLIVRFVPFSQLVNWVTGTPYLERGLSPEVMDIPTFEQEFEPANVPLQRMSVRSSHGLSDLGSITAASQSQSQQLLAQGA